METLETLETSSFRILIAGYSIRVFLELRNSFHTLLILI